VDLYKSLLCRKRLRTSCYHACVFLLPSTVIWFTGYWAVTLSDWEGNRRSGITMAMHYRLQWSSHLLKAWRGRWAPGLYACVERITFSILYLCGCDLWSQFVIKTLSPNVAVSLIWDPYWLVFNGYRSPVSNHSMTQQLLYKVACRPTSELLCLLEKICHLFAWWL